jgi:hypothetical protein
MSFAHTSLTNSSSLCRKRPRACYGDSGGTIHVLHEKENFDAPEAASLARATRTSRSRERVRTYHSHYGVRSSFPARQKKIFFREGTPELARPCRLFDRGNQTRPRPSQGDLEAKVCAVQRQSEQGNDHSNQDYSRERNAGWLFRVRLSADHYIHRASRPIRGQRPYIREHHHVHGPSRPIHG